MCSTNFLTKKKLFHQTRTSTTGSGKNDRFIRLEKIFVIDLGEVTRSTESHDYSSTTILPVDIVILMRSSCSTFLESTVIPDRFSLTAENQRIPCHRIAENVIPVIYFFAFLLAFNA